MKIITDHSTWCDHCWFYLSIANPAIRIFDHVLCLACIEKMRAALIAQVEADKARER